MPTATISDGYVAHVKVLAPLLRQIHRTIHQLEKDIALVLARHPKAAWWRSLPGAHGVLTSGRMLAWVGDDRNHFPTPETLQAIAGTAPVTRRSRKSLAVEFHRACSHPLAADDFARQSVRHSKWARAYLEGQVSRGHSAPWQIVG
jgi:transposase